MKKVLFLLVLLSFCGMNQGCYHHNEDSETEAETEADGDRYYIRYVVSVTTKDAKIPRVITIMTDKGLQTIQLNSKGQSSTWKGTYGPVKKDFESFVECKVPNYRDHSAIHAQIYVCIEEEPFVIKAEGTGDYALDLKYKIDF